MGSVTPEHEITQCDCEVTAGVTGLFIEQKEVSRCCDMCDTPHAILQKVLNSPWGKFKGDEIKSPIFDLCKKVTCPLRFAISFVGAFCDIFTREFYEAAATIRQICP